MGTNTKNDITKEPVVEDKYIKAVFDAIDALPPTYLQKFKNLRNATIGFTSYSAKIKQEFEFRRREGTIPVLEGEKPNKKAPAKLIEKEDEGTTTKGTK